MQRVSLIFNPNYKPSATVYNILPPNIPTGFEYQFITASGLLYEVQFARKENSLCMIMNFSVLGDEFEQEYPVTNRGELYSIIVTVMEVLHLFHEQHPFTKSFEFSGEHKELRDTKEASIRTRMYYRFAKRNISCNWIIELNANRVVISKRK